MGDIWYRTASDDEIAECPGDYIGCEICQNQKRCLEMKTQLLQKVVEVKEC